MEEMAPFDGIEIGRSVNTSSGDPNRDFFIPVMGRAAQYDIAVGYFTSAWMRDAAEGIAHFAANGGVARWVISPELTEDDYTALATTSGDIKRMDLLEDITTRAFGALYAGLKEHTRDTLAWLIADGILNFRIAIPRSKLTGIFHAKQGIFTDSHGNKVAFNGSYNFTGRASTNWEAVNIFCGWKSKDSLERCSDIESAFNLIWNELDPNLEIYEPREITYKRFVEHCSNVSRPYVVSKTCTRRSRIEVPPQLKLRPYQDEAITLWFKNNGRGIFNLATGAGKTVTALAAATKLVQGVLKKENQNLVIVIAVPYVHLAEQWVRESSEFGFEPVRCWGSSKKWAKVVDKNLNAMLMGGKRILTLITVNMTFSNSPFQQALENVKSNLLIIADEMHNLGAPKLQKSLPDKAQFRLGLSATPERHHDEEGTEALERYFGDIVIEFGLEEAIKKGFLCKYYYYPHLIPLTEDEMDEYQALSAKINVLMGASAKFEDISDGAKMLLIKRARLLGRAENKLVKLKALIGNTKESTHNIVYCGDSKCEDDERQIDKTLTIVKSLGVKANKFTADENSEERETLLKAFSMGDLQTLVAIRCLDEGVDVPQTQTAYILASSTNPRQFIQRRGRILRKAKGKKVATIHDFVAIPNLDVIRAKSLAEYNNERKLLKRELERVNEFASMAINFGETLERFREAKRVLNLVEL